MTIQWYAPAQWLGLVRDISELSDGSAWEVSRRCSEVFTGIQIALVIALFLSAFLLRLLCTKPCGKQIVYWGCGMLGLYALFLGIGVGPYLELYPHSAGFLDMNALEHAVSGLLCAAIAGTTFLCGSLGNTIRTLWKRRRTA